MKPDIRIFRSMNPGGLIGNQGNQMHGSLFRYPMNSIFTINNHMPWKVSAQRHRPQSKVSGASFDLLANCLLLLVTVFASLTVTVFASSTVTEFALNRNNTCLFEIKLFAIMLHLQWWLKLHFCSAFAATLQTEFLCLLLKVSATFFAGACKSIWNDTRESIYNNACNSTCAC